VTGGTPEQAQGGEHTTKTPIRCCRAEALSFPLVATYRAAAPCQGFPPARCARPLTGLPPRRKRFFQEEEMAALSRGVCTLSEDRFNQGISRYPLDFSYHE
jgi:hypothetical protein